MGSTCLAARLPESVESSSEGLISAKKSLLPNAEAQLTHEEALLVLKLGLPTGLQAGLDGELGMGLEAMWQARRSSHAVHTLLHPQLTVWWCAGALSAKQILEHEAAAKRIFTFCNELDNILGGGVATGQITEFCELCARRHQVFDLHFMACHTNF